MTRRSDGDELALRCLMAIQEALRGAEAELGRLDSVAGDGDHGSGMVRGIEAAVRAAETAAPGVTPDDESLLERAGSAFLDAAGGSSGALYGTLCRVLGAELRRGAGPASAVAAGLQAIMDLGGAKPGDKTMVDTLAPFVEVLLEAHDRGGGLAASLPVAQRAAQDGAASTAAMVPRRGRASRLGDRSVGSVDPGAESMLMIIEAVAGVLAFGLAGSDLPA